jgi:hypothetical protein
LFFFNKDMGGYKANRMSSGKGIFIRICPAAFPVQQSPNAENAVLTHGFKPVSSFRPLMISVGLHDVACGFRADENQGFIEISGYSLACGRAT